MRTSLQLSPYVAESYEQLMQERIVLPHEMNEAFFDKILGAYAVLEATNLFHAEYESDGLKVTGMVALPDPLPKEGVPLLIYNRGGSGNYGSLQIAFFMHRLLPFVKAGYAIAATNYRGNRGGEGQEQWGGDEVNDIHSLIACCHAQPWWNMRDTMMLGWSRGAMMSMIALRGGAPVQAAACMAGIYDMHLALANQGQMEDKVYARFIPGWPESKRAAFDARSAVQWPQEIATPLLLLHGDADEAVDVEHSRRMAQRLKSVGATYDYIEFPGGDHALRGARDQANDAILTWFSRYHERSHAA